MNTFGSFHFDEKGRNEFQGPQTTNMLRALFNQESQKTEDWKNVEQILSIFSLKSQWKRSLDSL